MEKIDWSKGDMVFLEGEKNDGFIYLLTKGKMIKSVHPVDDDSKVEKVVVRSGEFFGLNSVLSTSPVRRFTIQAIEECSTDKMNVKELQLLLEKDMKTLLKLLVHYSNEMVTIHRKIEGYLNLGNLFIDEKNKLYQSGIFYFKDKNVALSRYIFKKFIELYPEDYHTKEIKEKLKTLPIE